MRALITVLLFSFSFLFSTDYYVETTGTDNTSCSEIDPCANIQTAIDLTSDGDVVIVSGGTYLENLLIETGITLKSADATDPAIIDGSSPETDPALWNGGSCIVIRTPRGTSSRVTATVEDVHLTGGKGTVIIEDTNHDGDFDDPEDQIKIVGGGMIIHNAGLLSRGNKIMNNGDSSTKEGGAVYAAGTGVDIPDDNPADPPDYNLPNERSVIVFEGTTFSGNNAQIGHTVMVNGWDMENRFIDIDFGNSHFDCVFDSVDNAYDGVSEYWVKGKDNAAFDFTGGISSEIPAITTDVWVDPVIGVDEDNLTGNEGNPFLTIDYAMSMIYPTEDNPITIYLTAGTFSPLTEPFEPFPIIMLSNINLIGQGEELTILDAEQTDRVITMQNCLNNIISDLTITGGLPYDEGYFHIDSFGGGIYLINSNPTLTNISIIGNSTSTEDHMDYCYGGGIYLYNSSPTLTNVTISQNTSTGNGGGMYIQYGSHPILTDVIISGNTARSSGGGMFIANSSPLLVNVTIRENTSGLPDNNASGGGMFLSGCNSTFIDVTISGNTAYGVGGGMKLNTSNPTLINVAIIGNTGLAGGGMGLGHSNPALTHVIISGNTAELSGGGIYLINSNPTLTNVTISQNTAIDDPASTTPSHNGGGMILTFDSFPIITNTIIWDNFPESIYIYDNTQWAFITFSDIEGSWAGEGNIDANPLFTDPDNGDYRLSWDNYPYEDETMSPCIDAGTADLDGEGYDDITDYFGQAPDMGAYEFGSEDESCESGIYDYCGVCDDIPENDCVLDCAGTWGGDAVVDECDVCGGDGNPCPHSGDLNGDGVLNILDVVMLVNIVLGYGEPVDAGDLNGDGFVSVIDIVLLVNIILEE